MTRRERIANAAAAARSARQALRAASARHADAVATARHLIDNADHTQRAEKRAARMDLFVSVRKLVAEKLSVAQIARLCRLSPRQVELMTPAHLEVTTDRATDDPIPAGDQVSRHKPALPDSSLRRPAITPIGGLP
jgi:hypothetical protein